MTFESSIAFVLAMSLFVSSPGPGVMGCVAVAMRQSVSNSVSFIIGMIIGDIVYLSFAVFGLTAIATNFNSLFQVLRVAGGLYLIYLAVKLWRSKRLPSIRTTCRKKTQYVFLRFVHHTFQPESNYILLRFPA